MPYLLFSSYQIMWTLVSLPLQMAARSRRVQLVSVANHVKARQSLIKRAVTWLATVSGWARSKLSAICSGTGKLCGGFIILECCGSHTVAHISRFLCKFYHRCISGQRKSTLNFGNHPESGSRPDSRRRRSGLCSPRALLLLPECFVVDRLLLVA